MITSPRIAALAASGLVGAPPLPRTGWGALVDELADTGLTGLLAEARRTGHARLDGDTSARVDEQLVAEATEAVRIEGELLRLAPHLREAGTLLLDGAVLAHHVYADPQLRPLAGIDLLVPEAGLPVMSGALSALGYEARPGPQPPTAALTMRHPGGVVVGLHVRLQGGAGDVDVADLFGQGQAVAIGPVAVHTLSWEAHLVAAAFAAVADPDPQPLVLRDMAQMAAFPGLDLEAAIDLAERWGASDVIVAALQRTVDALRLDLPGARPSPVPAPRDTVLDTVDLGAPQPGLAPVPARGSVGTHTIDVPPALAAVALLRAAPAAARPSDSPFVPVAPRPAPSTVRRPERPRPAGPARQGEWSTARAERKTPVMADTTPPPEAPTTDRPMTDGSSLGGLSPFEPPPNGLGIGMTGAALLLLSIVSEQLDGPRIASVLVPAGGVCLAVGASRRIARTRPDEAWVGRWLVLGVVAKVVASYLRYLTLVIGYEGVGDATGYSTFGRRFARAWRDIGVAPDLTNLRETNFIRFFTGIVYYLFGTDMLVGYFVYGLLAIVGAYCWYRAAADAVPILDRRLFLALILFAPSVVFWPSSIGKESLMQLGIGVVALATSLLLRQRLVTGLLTAAAGGWVVWVVRPHLLAFVAVAAVFAYLVGRVRAGDKGFRSFLARPIGIVMLVVLLGFVVGQAADFLGIEDLSVASLESEFDEQVERSSIGGSSYQIPGSPLNPLRLPLAATNVLLRPFPWEVESPFQILASVEAALLAVFIALRLSSLRVTLVRARSIPFLLFCWSLILIYVTAFSSFANFGLLVRQRSLILPAVFVLLCVSPALDRAARARSRERVDA